MNDGKAYTGDADLDAALDTLRAPPPTPLLERRVRAMAPRRSGSGHVRWVPRAAVAAALAVTVAGVALLQTATTREQPAPAVAASSAAASSVDAQMVPADEIVPHDLALVDEPSSREVEAEPFSVAVMPLE